MLNLNTWTKNLNVQYVYMIKDNTLIVSVRTIVRQELFYQLFLMCNVYMAVINVFVWWSFVKQIWMCLPLKGHLVHMPIIFIWVMLWFQILTNMIDWLPFDI